MRQSSRLRKISDEESVAPRCREKYDAPTANQFEKVSMIRSRSHFREQWQGSETPRT